MRNTARSNIHSIRIDLERSEGSYLYDSNRVRPILDFFSMYSSLALGYNHPVFDSRHFIDAALSMAPVKVTNCFINTKYSTEFDKKFTQDAPEEYKHFYYCCTGALAVEAAVKTAIYHRYLKDGTTGPTVITYRNSFHGINSWSCFLTSRTGINRERLEGLPQPFSTKIATDLKVTEDLLKTGRISAVLVEPIQCTAGDIYLHSEFLEGVRDLCTEYEVPLIFDEIQTGFYTTGKAWYCQHLGISPDILVFGKKTQLSGIMVKEHLSAFLQQPEKFEVTWDATQMDMLRCLYILKAIQDYDLVQNVLNINSVLSDELRRIPKIRDVRCLGVLAAFDLEDKEKRDSFVQRALSKGLLVNQSGDTTIRLRPNLATTQEEVHRALDIIKSTV